MARAVDVKNDDDVLAYAQEVRKKMVDVLTEEGIPVTRDDREVLLATLGQLSGTAIQKKRLGVDEAANDNNKAALTAINNVLNHFGERNPFQGKSEKVINGASERVVDVGQLPDANIAPGETEVGIVQQNYDNFMNELKD